MTRLAKILIWGFALFFIVLVCLSFYPYLFGNKQFFDSIQDYDYAIIELPNGEIVEGEVEYWTDYEDGEQLQVKFEDGDTYLTSSYNCTLIDNEK